MGIIQVKDVFLRCYIKLLENLSVKSVWPIQAISHDNVFYIIHFAIPLLFLVFGATLTVDMPVRFCTQ